MGVEDRYMDICVGVGMEVWLCVKGGVEGGCRFDCVLWVGVEGGCLIRVEGGGVARYVCLLGFGEEVVLL